jgi:ribose/xylose/arabinose/galactoside ABC-type transport system permease subunit
MIVVDLGIAALGLLFVWLIGGIALRLGGLALILAGISGMVVLGSPKGLLVAGTGSICWLLGHLHYAFRHQEFKSALARRLFCRWAPAWLDPTAGWELRIGPERRHGERSMRRRERR